MYTLLLYENIRVDRANISTPFELINRKYIIIRLPD